MSRYGNHYICEAWVRATYDEEGLLINWKAFHHELRNAFATYLRDLRKGDDQVLRDNLKSKMYGICRNRT